MNAAPQRAHDQDVLIRFMAVASFRGLSGGAGCPWLLLPGHPACCHAAAMTSRTSDRARCLSGSGRIRVRLSRVSQDRAVRTWSRYSPGGLDQPVGGVRDLLGGLRLEDQPQRGAGFLDVAGHPVGDQTLGWHGDELGDEQFPLPAA